MTMTNQHARVRLTGQLLTGLVLASLGILFTLDNLHILEARDFLRYWPVTVSYTHLTLPTILRV